MKEFYITGEYPLTAEEIMHLDIIEADRYAADAVLRVAVNFAMNRRSDLYTEESKWWRAVLDKHQLSEKVKWTIDRRRGLVMVVPDEEK